jgi:superfamily II DNA or RNA helicase
MEIKIINNIFCQVNNAHDLDKLLYVKKQKRVMGMYKSSIEDYNAPIIRKGLMPTGFIPSVKKFCQQHNLEFSISGTEKKLEASHWEKDSNITLFKDQLKLVECARNIQRGVIKSPTGTGKTVVAYAIIKSFKERAIFFCDSKTLLYQTYERFKKQGLKTSLVGDGNKDLSGDVVIAMASTLKSIPQDQWADKFGVCIVDECHDGLKWGSRLFSVLCYLQSTVRIGLSATPREEHGEERAMWVEGLLGPIIGSYEYEQAEKDGRIIKPVVQLISIPENKNISQAYNFQDIYKLAIVYNSIRNMKIAQVIQNEISQQRSCLVYVVQLDHANNIQEKLNKIGIDSFIVNGAVDGEDREKMRNEINAKKIMCIIATSAWKKGVDIVSLNTVINAGLIKDETGIIQASGRCMRQEKGKVSKIIDFLDIGKYLSINSIKRIQTYVDKGWL